jgi:hypothetical protein
LENNSVAVLYSAGSDSSLVAIKMAKRFDQVHLLTFLRKGTHGTEHVLAGVKRLETHVNSPNKFVHQFIKTDKLLKFVMYERYWTHYRKHKKMVLSMCGQCKVSFHWRALIYCLENGIKHIADGAVRIANVYPEQNEVIMLNRLRQLYATFGITYETPIYEEGELTEQILYELRYSRNPKVKGQKDDLQFVCEQQVLYAMFLRNTLHKMPFEEFEKKMAAYYKEKLDMVEEMTKEYLEKGPDSRLAKLIEGPQES